MKKLILFIQIILTVLSAAAQQKDYVFSKTKNLTIDADTLYHIYDEGISAATMNITSKNKTPYIVCFSYNNTSDKAVINSNNMYFTVKEKVNNKYSLYGEVSREKYFIKGGESSTLELNNGDKNFMLDMYIMQTTITDLQITDMSDTSISISWDDSNPNHDKWTVVISSDKYVFTEKQATITGLYPGNVYTLSIYPQEITLLECAVQQLYCHTTGQDNCIDFLNVMNTDVATCYTGHSDLSSTKITDTGFVEGRFQIMTDIYEKDYFTNNLLSCIPEGENYSVKIGNISHDGTHNLEAISYSVDVDTNNYAILLINYALVVHDYGHTKNEQPRMNISIYDSTGKLLDANCGVIYFYAGDNSSWNECKRNHYFKILWKDWSTFALDISKYHGQKIQIQINVRDCVYSWDFGYAYFTIHCAQKNISMTSCSFENEAISAPDGFTYRWYEQDKSNNILSTEKDFTPEKYGWYCCDLVSLYKKECYSTINTYIGQIYPYAHFSIDTTNVECGKIALKFHNQSMMTIDEQHTQPINYAVSGFIWSINDSVFSTEEQPDSLIVENGTYNISLTINANNVSCKQIFDTTITVNYECIFDTIYRDICQGDTLEFYELKITNTGEYHHFTFNESHVCYVTVHPLHETFDTLYLCKGQEGFEWNGLSITHEGDYTAKLSSTDECDSVAHLTVLNDGFDTLILAVIRNDEIYTLNDFNENTSGEYSKVYSTVHGCDSVIRLKLTVLEHANIWAPTAIIDNSEGNDKFRIFYDNENVEIKSIEIFDRWGTCVFKGNSVSDTWDGKYNGQPCPQGVYVWKLIYYLKTNTEKDYLLSGELTVLH